MNAVRSINMNSSIHIHLLFSNFVNQIEYNTLNKKYVKKIVAKFTLFSCRY